VSREDQFQRRADELQRATLGYLERWQAALRDSRIGGQALTDEIVERCSDAADADGRISWLMHEVAVSLALETASPEGQAIRIWHNRLLGKPDPEVGLRSTEPLIGPRRAAINYIRQAVAAGRTEMIAPLEQGGFPC
jgi:hypothetical protein